MSEEKGESEEIVSRIYTIPLSRAWIAPRHRRAKRAVRIVREFAQKHMKSEIVKIDERLNELIWSRGIRNPPRRVMVKMEKDEEGVVQVSLLEAEKSVEEALAEASESSESLEEAQGSAAVGKEQ